MGRHVTVVAGPLCTPLFDGGPVYNDKLFYIHKNKNIPESIKIGKNLSISMTNMEIKRNRNA